MVGFSTGVDEEIAVFDVDDILGSWFEVMSLSAWLDEHFDVGFFFGNGTSKVVGRKISGDDREFFVRMSEMTYMIECKKRQ